MMFYLHFIINVISITKTTDSLDDYEGFNG